MCLIFKFQWLRSERNTNSCNIPPNVFRYDKPFFAGHLKKSVGYWHAGRTRYNEKLKSKLNKQEVHGPHHSPEKLFHFAQSYMKHWLEEKKTNYLFLRIEWTLFVKPWVPFHKGIICQLWLKLAQWFWRRRFLKLVNVFSLFRNYPPLEKGVGNLFPQLLPSSPVGK